MITICFFSPIALMSVTELIKTKLTKLEDDSRAQCLSKQQDLIDKHKFTNNITSIERKTKTFTNWEQQNRFKSIIHDQKLGFEDTENIYNNIMNFNTRTNSILVGSNIYSTITTIMQNG